MFSPQNPVPFSPPFIPSLHTSGPFTNPIILLINALLTQRRIIFLGHEKPASVVAGSVLAACALGSGGGSVLRGFTERAFPYANLAGLDVLKQVPGYIAGVTNPRFEDLSSRWDVICNIQTGRITVSKDIKPDTWTIPTPVLHVASAFSQSAHPLPPLSSTSAPAASATGGLGSPTESSVGGEDNPAFSESSLVRQATPNFGEDVVGSLAGGGGNSDAASIYEGAAGNSVLASSTSSKGRQQRSDSSASNMSSGKGEWATRGIDTDAVFMDEVSRCLPFYSAAPAEQILSTRRSSHSPSLIAPRPTFASGSPSTSSASSASLPATRRRHTARSLPSSRSGTRRRRSTGPRAHLGPGLFCSKGRPTSARKAASCKTRPPQQSPSPVVATQTKRRLRPPRRPSLAARAMVPLPLAMPVVPSAEALAPQVYPGLPPSADTFGSL